jgi:hypothetical protein
MKMYRNEDCRLLACNISFWKWRQLLKQICWLFSTQPHGVTSHKTIIFTLTVVRTSHFSLITFKKVGILWNFRNVQLSKMTLCCVVVYQLLQIQSSQIKIFLLQKQCCIYKTSLHFPPDRTALRVTTCSEFV